MLITLENSSIELASTGQLSIEGLVSCSMKQREPLVGFDLTTDR